MKLWHQISKDPNSEAAIQSRRNALISARTKSSICDRADYLCQLAKDQDVLDVGVVDHTIESTENPDWLHGKLCQVAKTCLGVDILEEEVNELRKKGFNLICIDITEKPLDQRFDLIICGDIIEHLNKPGSLLASASQMLKPSGKIVLTVPNPWYINIVLKNAFNGSPYIDNVDHVTWFDACTLCELGERHGLSLNHFVGVTVRKVSSFPAKLLFGLAPLLIHLGLRPELFSKTMIYEFILGNSYAETHTPN